MPGFELFDEAEKEQINEVMQKGFTFRYNFDAMRNDVWKARELEQMICDSLGVKHAHVVSSGTAALSTALAAAGIGAGDEVIVPTLTFIATANAVTYTGATPVFVDSEPETWNLDPAEVE